MIQVALTKEPNKEKKSCVDCFYCQGAVSWWCINNEASDFRGTSIPNAYNCSYWKPAKMWKDLTVWQETIWQLH